MGTSRAARDAVDKVRHAGRKANDKADELLDQALDAAGSRSAGHVAALRERHPADTDEQIAARLDGEFLTAVTASGAATGGAAAVPGAGTAAATSLAAGDVSWFLTAAAAYVLGILDLRGYAIDDPERRKAVVLAILAGHTGTESRRGIQTGTGTAVYVGTLLRDAAPRSTVRTVNRVLRRKFMLRFGRKQGLASAGKIVPLGVGVAIGAGGNRALARQIIRNTRRAVAEAGR